MRWRPRTSACSCASSCCRGPGGALGRLGDGKTTLARAIIRELTGDPALEVPSPTFTLVQPYTARDGRSIVHADLYRLRDPDELVELGFEEMAEGAITLVEWPEKMPAQGGPLLSVTLALRPEFGEGSRFARIEGFGGMQARIDRARAVRKLLARAGWDDAERILMQGDASSRAYERLRKPDGTTAVLMISRRGRTARPVRDGKPYSAIVHLAESVHAFVALDRGLRALGFSAPKVYGEDLNEGLLILEDLGSEPVIENGAPGRSATRRRCGCWPSSTPPTARRAAGGGGDRPRHPALRQGGAALRGGAAAGMVRPAIRGVSLTQEVRDEFVALWREALDGAVPPARPGPCATTIPQPDLLPNGRVWSGSASSTSRTQPERDPIIVNEALHGPDVGHPAYDVASLQAGCPRRRRADFELRLLGLYVRERRAPAIRTSTWAPSPPPTRCWRRSGATKILGIFARLDRRDGKPGYLAHLPRIEGYLARNLAHRRWRPCGTGMSGTCPAPSPTTKRPDPATARTTSMSDAPETPITRAFVLAAGLGTRMRPVTDTLPKPGGEVAGKPLLDHALDRAAEAGLTDAVVNVHWLAEQIEAHLAPAGGAAAPHRLGRARGAAGDRRRHPQGAAADGRGALRGLNSDSFWLEGPEPNLSRLIAAGTARGWTRSSSWRPPRRASATRARAIS